jgi:iron uptake system component EfeO
VSPIRHALARSIAAGAVAALGILVAACAPSGTATPVGSPPEGSIAVTATDFKFDPSAMTTKAGETTFVVTNKGAVEHEFEIFKGETVVDEVEGLVPGLTRELTVTLDAGDYTYVCKLAGHEEAGMTGALTVTQ